MNSEELKEKILKEKEIAIKINDDNTNILKISAFDVLDLVVELSKKSKNGVSELQLSQDLGLKAIKKNLEGEKKEDLLLRNRFLDICEFEKKVYVNLDDFLKFLLACDLVNTKEEKIVVTEHGKKVYKDIVATTY